MKIYRLYTGMGKNYRSSWIKEEAGMVIDASPAFRWAIGKFTKDVKSWCIAKDISVKKLHGNVKHLENYL